MSIRRRSTICVVSNKQNNPTASEISMTFYGEVARVLSRWTEFRDRTRIFDEAFGNKRRNKRRGNLLHLALHKQQVIHEE
jgi:hypothetical protein